MSLVKIYFMTSVPSRRKPSWLNIFFVLFLEHMFEKSFTLRFPSLNHGFSWRMSVSQIFVSFHLGQFSTEPWLYRERVTLFNAKMTRYCRSTVWQMWSLMGVCYSAQRWVWQRNQRSSRKTNIWKVSKGALDLASYQDVFFRWSPSTFITLSLITHQKLVAW